MTIDVADVALAEFNALRSAILAREEATDKAVAAALTAVAAIGGFALAKKDGRLEMLLILPFVLSGLGLYVVEAGRAMQRMGAYLRDSVWERLPPSTVGEFRSWEDCLSAHRVQHEGRPSAHILIRGLSTALIFVVPSISSLALTQSSRTSALGPLWWGGIVALILFCGLALTVLRSTPLADDKRRGHA